MLLNERHDALIDRLCQNPIGGYLKNGPDASEPIAWTAIALHQAGISNKTNAKQSLVGAEWLAKQQKRDGSVGVTADQATPAWPTSLAIQVWQTVDSAKYANQIRSGVDWALAQKPWTRPKHDNFGHDTMLEGWSWAADTHSWLEPTAFFVRAFQAIGKTEHPRYKQAVSMLVDRLLPAGGANYGNTIILGQELLQHLQPTGIVTWALANEVVDDLRLDRTLDFLQQALLEPTGIASLSYAVLGITSHAKDWNDLGDVDRLINHVDEVAKRALSTAGIYKAAIMTLAIQALLNLFDEQGEVTE